MCKSGLGQGEKRDGNDKTGPLPTQAEARLWKKGEVTATRAKGPCPQKSGRQYGNPSWGKLGPNWESPYRVTLVAGIGAFRLEDLDGNTKIRPWNVNNLKRYYY